MKIIPITALFKAAGRLVRKDPVILVPHAIFFLLLKIAEITFTDSSSWESLVVKTALLGWWGNVVAKGITILIADQLIQNRALHIGDCFSALGRRLWTLSVASFGLSIPLFLAFYALQIQKTTFETADNKVLFFGLLLSLIPASLILEFIPIVIIRHQLGPLKSILHCIRFIWKNFAKTLQLVSTMLCGAILAVIGGAILDQIPVLGPAILNVGLQAIAYGFMYILVILFYDLITREAQTIDIAV